MGSAARSGSGGVAGSTASGGDERGSDSDEADGQPVTGPAGDPVAGRVSAGGVDETEVAVGAALA